MNDQFFNRKISFCLLVVVMCFGFTAMSYGVAVVSVDPAKVTSSAAGEELTVNIKITGGAGIAGYEIHISFDPTALEFVSAAYADYLPADAITLPVEVSSDTVILAAVSPIVETSGDGTLATVTFKVVEAKASIISLTRVTLVDSTASLLEGTTMDGMVTARRRVIVTCPVGWQRQTNFGTPTPHVMITAIELEIDTGNWLGIYTPVALEIYADPADNKENLEGWKLNLGIPYNYTGKEYRLTAENSVFNEEGILRIENTDIPGGLPMTSGRVGGQELPGFNYHLFDDTNQRVDLAISCYLQGGIAQKLGEMPYPRIERELDLKTLTWQTYYKSQWQAAPADWKLEPSPNAPSLLLKMTAKWANLKKQR